MKKSVVAVLLCVALILSFSACKSSEETKEIETVTEVISSVDENGEIVTEVVAVDAESGEVIEETTKAGVFGRIFGGDDNKTEEADKVENDDPGKAKAETTTAKFFDRLLGKTEAPQSTVNDSVEEAFLEELSMTPEEESYFSERGIDLNNLFEENATSATMAIKDGTMPRIAGTTANVPEASRSQKYKDIIKSGKFMIEAVAQGDDGTTLPLKMYYSNGKYRVSATAPVDDGASMKIEFLNDGKNVYLIMPTLKIYMNAGSAEELLGEDTQAITDMLVNINGDAAYKGTGNVEYNGKTYVCETYEKDSMTVNQYYLGDELKRIEQIEKSSDGKTSTYDIDIVRIQGTVSDSVFSVPVGYVDMTDVLNADGFEGVKEATGGQTTTTTAKAKSDNNTTTAKGK